MASITDVHGTRELSDFELAQIYEKSNQAFRTFMDARVWQPIDMHDPDNTDEVLVALGSQWAFGFFGPNPDFSAAAKTDPIGPAWRHAQDFRHGALIEFAPEVFAVVDDYWREELMMD